MTHNQAEGHAEQKSLEKLVSSLDWAGGGQGEESPPRLYQMLSLQDQAGSAILPPVSICEPVACHLNLTF